MQKIKEYLYTHQDSLSFLIILFFSGILCGILLLTYFDEKEISSLSTYLTTLPSANVDKHSFFANQVFINSLFLIGISIMSFALFTIPIIAFIMFTKGVQIGFSCAMYYYMYHINGILGIITTLLPQILFDLLAFVMVACVAMETSMLLYACIFRKESFVLSTVINRLLTDLLIGLILILLSNFLKSTILIQYASLFL